MVPAKGVVIPFKTGDMAGRSIIHRLFMISELRAVLCRPSSVAMPCSNSCLRNRECRVLCSTTSNMHSSSDDALPVAHLDLQNTALDVVICWYRLNCNAVGEENLSATESISVSNGCLQLLHIHQALESRTSTI